MEEVTSLDTINLEPFKEVLLGEIIIPDQGIHTSAHSLVTTLINNSIAGGAGTTFHIAKPTRYPTATISGVLVSAASLMGHLDIIHSAQPSQKYWELVALRIPSVLPGLSFEIDFLPELSKPAINVQCEQIDIDSQNVDYATKQVAEGLTSFLRLLRARSNA